VFTKTMKWVCITALLTALLWCPLESSVLLLQFIVCVGFLLLAVKAVRTSKYFWGAGFVAIAMLFNPVALVARSRNSFLWLDVMCLATFMAALAAVKSKPLHIVPGIINPNRRGYAV